MNFQKLFAAIVIIKTEKNGLCSCPEYDESKLELGSEVSKKKTD